MKKYLVESFQGSVLITNLPNNMSKGDILDIACDEINRHHVNKYNDCTIWDCGYPLYRSGLCNLTMYCNYEIDKHFEKYLGIEFLTDDEIIESGIYLVDYSKIKE